MHIVLIISLFFIYWLTGGDASLKSLSVRRKQVIWMGIILFLFAALRAYTVGTDIWGYFNDYYRDAAYSSYSELWEDRQGRDPLFHCVLRFLNIFSSTPQFMLMIIGGIVAAGFSYFTYYQKGNVLLFYILFIGFRMYAFTLSGLRQACAMAIVYVAYTQLKDNKVIKYLLLTLLASLFHQSALVALLFYPIFKIKKDWFVFAGSGAVVLGNIVTGNALAGGLAMTVFRERFEGYVQRSEGYSDWGLTFIIYLIVFLLILSQYKQMGKLYKGFHEDFRLLCVAIVFAFIGQTTDSVFRVNYYFIFIIIPLFSQFLESIKRKETARMLTWFVIILMSAQYLILGAAGIQEYQFFWENPYIIGKY